MATGASRAERESEKIFKEIWFMLPNLVVCVWYPLRDEALGLIEMLRQDLDRLEEQLRKEGEVKK